MTYTITNTTSGADLGTYQGDTPLDAYRAMMRDAGYRTQAEAESAGYSLDEIPADVRVERPETVTVMAAGGTTWQIRRGEDSLGSIDFGDLDEDGQWVGDLDELADAVRAECDLDDDTEIEIN